MHLKYQAMHDAGLQGVLMDLMKDLVPKAPTWTAFSIKPPTLKTQNWMLKVQRYSNKWLTNDLPLDKQLSALTNKQHLFLWSTVPINGIA